jgi:effector-binding domain-containing protein
MKRGIIVLAVLIITLSIALFATYTVTTSATIKTPMFDLSGLLTDLNNWKKWDTSFFNKDDSVSIVNSPGVKQSHAVDLQGRERMKLTVINPAFLLIEQNGVSSQVITMQTAPQNQYTDVQWITKKAGWQWLRDKVTGNDEISPALNNLRKFAENTADLYGFPIRMTKVIDPVFCTKRVVVQSANFKYHIPELLADLHRFMAANKMTASKDYYYVSSSPLMGDKTELGVGIPVQSFPHARDGFEILELPVDGHLLIGSYKGLRSEIQHLYNAMDKFVLDKHLSKVAQPMELYTDEPAAPDQKGSITMQIVYPIY